MTRYVQVKVRKRRLVADAARACLTSETFLILVTALVLGLLLGGVIGPYLGVMEP